MAKDEFEIDFLSPVSRPARHPEPTRNPQPSGFTISPFQMLIGIAVIVLAFMLWKSEFWLPRPGDTTPADVVTTDNLTKQYNLEMAKVYDRAAEKCRSEFADLQDWYQFVAQEKKSVNSRVYSSRKDQLDKFNDDRWDASGMELLSKEIANEFREAGE